MVSKKEIYVKIREKIENEQFAEACEIAKTNGVLLCPNNNTTKTSKKYLNCPSGQDEDHIIPRLVLHEDLGKGNRRCLPAGKNRDSANERAFKKYLLENGGTCFCIPDNSIWTKIKNFFD